ncbi:hypothetical protein CRG98_040114 [Punica granatum]|uniref:Uncharacterized protein n=1 Tax=Punica granatum TaxID=22663 RepID=A0A2I0I685_PUNGR|nr:hypothetical protein CRG98_040114 [Punica granatum]
MTMGFYTGELGFFRVGSISSVSGGWVAWSDQSDPAALPLPKELNRGIREGGETDRGLPGRPLPLGLGRSRWAYPFIR